MMRPLTTDEFQYSLKIMCDTPSSLNIKSPTDTLSAVRAVHGLTLPGPLTTEPAF